MIARMVWLARIAFVACSALTLFEAFAPLRSPGRVQLFPWDKAEHFSAFFAITASGILAMPRVSLLRLGLALSLAGALIEVIQATPLVARDADVFDWVADTLAICAVMGVVVAARWRREGGG